MVATSSRCGTTAATTAPTTACRNQTARDAYGFHLPSAGLDTYGATSVDDGASWSVVRLSSVSQMPNYEMFGDRRVPFHGDYNYVSSVGNFAYGAWIDTRQVAGGDDWG